MHAEITRVQLAIFQLAEAQRDRLKKLSRAEVAEIQHEAENIKQTGRGSVLGAAEITVAACKVVLAGS